MEGGPSHIDTFDPKPALEKYAGQPMPESYGRPLTAMPGTSHNTLMPSQREWAQHGESGLWVSNWYPHVARHADDLAVIRSCHADGLNHVGSVCQMNTGSILAGRPSMGSWVTYGLGTANRNLPTYVILNDEVRINGGSKNWSAGFLPAAYQGTLFKQEGAPILNLETPGSVGGRQQRGKLDLLASLNTHHAERHPHETGTRRAPAVLPSWPTGCRPTRRRPWTWAGSRNSPSGYTAWTRRRPLSTAGTCCSRGGWWSGACDSCRPTAEAGTPTPRSSRTTRSGAGSPTGRSPGC